MRAFAKKSGTTTNSAFVKNRSGEEFFGVQAKLSIGKPNDKYEAEADNVADKVVNKIQTKKQEGTAAPFFSPAITVQKKAGQKEEEKEVQEKPLSESITPLVVQRQPEEEKVQEKCADCEQEEKVQKKGLLKEEESVQKKEEEEEKPVQKKKEEEKPIQKKKKEKKPVVQRKCAECGKEEPVQKKEIQLKSVMDSSAPIIQEKCAECEAKEEGKEGGLLQRKEGAAFPPLPEGVTEEKEQEEMPQGEEEAAKGEEAAKEGEEAAKEGKEEAAGAPAEAAANDLQPPKKEEKKEKEELPPIQSKKDTTVQRASNGNSTHDSVEQSLSASKGKGSPMSSSTQQEMSSGFGADFSNVRIHTGSSAVQMNKDLGSHAFTHGSDIYFNQGKYNPESDSGKHLLAHELTHTVQQGASGSSVQRWTPPEKKAQPEGKPEKPNDGAQVEGKSHNKINNDDRVKDQDDLDADEIKEKKDPPRGEVRSERSSVQSEGVTTPPVDRGAEAQDKISEQKAQMNEQLSAEAAGGEGEGEGKGGEEAAAGNMGEADAAEQQAKADMAAAKAVEIPAEPQKFKHPNVVAPKDSAGKPLPRKANIDTQVRGLGYIAEMLREKGYEMKKHAAEKETHSKGLDASLNTSRKDLALAREGTKKTEEHNTERKEISETSKKALDESKQRQQFVAQEAPGLAAEADKGKGDSSALASDANSKAAKSKSEIPDDPDAKADAQKQSGEMDQTASGAQSMDDAITQTGERARQYIADAEKASADNAKAEGDITENDAVVAQIDGKVAEMKGANEQSQASIDNSAGGPDLIRQHAKKTTESGDELIAATMVMETELNSLQDEYLAGMGAIESKEDAEKRLKKEQEEKQKQQASPEELQVYAIAGMPEKEQKPYFDSLQPKEQTGVLAALDKMIAVTPDDGTEATEGKRMEVKLSSGGGGPQDPRQADIDAVDNKRIQRLGGVLDIADAKMHLLSQAQQRMLAERLVAESITDDIKNISVMQMAKGMVEGMINPMASLQGVVGGFEKTFSGVANIFNADAWAKDPLGNLLQIAADISTGLAMVFSSILGIAGMITALMVALTIISWGTLSPITGPVIGWMGTVMTYAGWGAIIAGLLSVYFNSLAYIKNLNDAGTATTARELFGNTEQMKKNAQDGFTGAMAVVEGVGAVKMGPVMKSGAFMKNVPKSPGAFARQTVNGAKEGLESLAKAPGRIAAGAKKLFAGGKTGLKNFKKKIQSFFSKSSKNNKLDFDVDAPGPGGKKQQQKHLDSSKKKKSDELTPSEKKAEVDAAAKKDVRDIDKNSEFAKDYDMEVEVNGHTYRRRKDGQGWCRFSDKPSACKIDLPAEGKAKLDKQANKKKKDKDPTETSETGETKPDATTDTTPDATPDAPAAPAKKTSKKHRDFEAEIERRSKLDPSDKDYIDPATAKKLEEYSQSTKHGPNRDIDGVIDDIKDGKVLDADTSRFSETPDARKEFWTDDRVKSLEKGGGKEIDVKADPDFKARKEKVEADIKAAKKKNEDLLAESKKIDDIDDPVKKKEALDKADQETKDFHEQRENSFAEKHPDDKIKADSDKKFDEEFGGTELDTPENRQKAFEKEKLERKKQHGEDFARSKTNAKKGDIFEESRVAGTDNIKHHTGHKIEVEVDGKKMNVSPDIEVPGPPREYIEMKSGPLTLDAKTKDQILRYAAMKDKITYELLSGATDNVKDFLKKHGIDYIDYTQIP